MTESKRMPLEDLRKTPEYTRLTPKQKMFVDTYCSSGAVDGQYDAVAATQAAYKCKSAEVARVMAYSLLANINLVAVLNRHFGTEPIDAFLATLDRAVHNKKLTLAQLGALQLQCEVMGFGTKIIPSPDHGFLAKDPTPKAEKKPRKTQKAPKTPAAAPPGASTFDLKQFE